MAEKKVIEIEIKDNFKKVEKGIDDLNKSLKDTAENNRDVSKSFEEIYGDLQPLTARMGEAEDRLYELAAAGKTASKEYEDLLKTVADYRKVQISTDMVIDAASSTMSTKMVNAIGGVANGFSAVEGAMGLVGVESEEVQQAMLRVQSAMALSQGLEGLKSAGIAFKQLGVAVKSTTVFTTAYNFVVYGTTKATTAQTIATGIQTGATTASTTATKLLRLAMLSLPIVAIVAGLVALANSMGVFGDKTEDAEAKQKRLDAQLEKTNKQIENQKKSTDSLNEIIDKQTRIDLIKAKTRGASEAELLRIQEDGAKRRIEILQNEAKQAEKLYLKLSRTGSTKEFEAAETAMLEIQKELSDARLTLQETEAERIYQSKQKTIEKSKTQNQNKLNAEQEYNNKLREFQDAIEAERQAKITDAKEKELQDLDNKYEQLYAKADASGQSDKELIAKQQAEITAINDKYAKIQADALLKAKADANALKLQQEQEFQAKIEEIDEANFQAGLQKTMTEEEYQLELVRQKYFTLEELAKGNAEQLAIIEQAKANEIGAITKTASDKELADAKAVAEQKVAIQQQGLDTALQGVALIKGVFEKSKGVQKAAVIAESAIGIAKMIISNKLANVAALATPQAIATSGAAAVPVIAMNNVSTGLGIAANIAATSKALKTLGGGSAPDGGGGLGGSGGGAGGVVAPNLNVVGDTGINQLATLQQQPVKAYVVSNDVTSAQQFDMKVQQTAQI
jgi:hypothetical protein